MSQQTTERANGKIRVSTWDQPDPFPWIVSTGFVSPRHAPKAPPANGQRCGRMKWFSEAKGYGFTACNVFVHARNVVSGEIRPGSRICFDVKETPKGPEAVNVRVIG